LINTARKSSGKLIFPLSKEQKDCVSDDDLYKSSGCNLTEQPAKILAWLKGLKEGKSLTIGNYTYLDSDLHVKLSLAADAVISGLTAAKPNTNIAFLCTPTDLHFIPDAAHKVSNVPLNKYLRRKILTKLFFYFLLRLYKRLLK